MPIEAVRIVTNAGAARNFQRSPATKWRRSSFRFHGKTQNEKVQPSWHTVVQDRFKGINPSCYAAALSVIVLLSRADLLDKNHLPHSALPLRSYAADVHTYTTEDFAKSDQSPSTPPRALIKRRHRNRPIGLAVS